MSVVFYKFRSAKDYDTCTFDGSGISVFELKREIMLAKKLGKGTDFDLSLYNAQTNEEYVDDNFVIQRNTSVLVSRNPAIKPGKGTAQRYLLAAASGVGAPSSGPARGGRSFQPQHANMAPNRSDFASASSVPAQSAATAPQVHSSSDAGGSDQDKIVQMMQQEAENWRQTQDQMAAQKPVFRPGGFGRGARAPPGSAGGNYGYAQAQNTESRPPPPGYICYRCGQKGHYINQCPTIGDKNFDNRPKLKRTTGIPKAFLKTVNPQDSLSGHMVTQTGEIVVAAPNEYAWSRFNAQRRTYLGVGDAYELAPVLPELECSICHRLLRDAMTAPCCNANYCDECIRQQLLEPEDPSMKFKCPQCEKDLVPDVLITNRHLRKVVEEHLREFAAKVNAANDRDSPSAEAESVAAPVHADPSSASTTPAPSSNTAFEQLQATKMESAVPANASRVLSPSVPLQQSTVIRPSSGRVAYTLINPPAPSTTTNAPATAAATHENDKAASSASLPYRIIDVNNRPSEQPGSNHSAANAPVYRASQPTGMPHYPPFAQHSGAVQMQNSISGMMPMHGMMQPPWPHGASMHGQQQFYNPNVAFHANQHARRPMHVTDLSRTNQQPYAASNHISGGQKRAPSDAVDLHSQYARNGDVDAKRVRSDSVESVDADGRSDRFRRAEDADHDD